MSAILGEYWIYADGTVDYSDGDIGADNHETMAIRHAQCRVAHVLDRTFDLDQDDFEAFMADIPPSPETRAQLHDLPPGLLDVAHGRGDARAYAMRQWGWVWVRGDTIVAWRITPTVLRTIATGVANILEETLDSDEPLVGVEVIVGSEVTGKQYHTLLADLLAGETSLGQVPPGVQYKKGIV